MNSEEQYLYDQIMAGGYHVITSGKLMIAGDIEILKQLLAKLENKTQAV